MEKSSDDSSAKRLKTTHEQNFCSTFECLSGELIFNLFQYFNTKEILQSFSDLTSFITSCIFDRHQRIHVHLDRQMSTLSEKYSPDQAISLHIERLAIPIDKFLNLKSLHIVYENVWEDECLNMVKQIDKLSQLINFKLSLVGPNMTSIDDEVIEAALSHSSLQKIILSKNCGRPHFYVQRRNSSLKLMFSVQTIFVGSAPRSLEPGHFRKRSNLDMSLFFKTQHHIQHLDIDFKSWKLHLLDKFLSAQPLLITLKIKGFCCCNYVIGWLDIDTWEQMLQKLPLLQRVAIEICLAIPMRLREKSVKRFNERAIQNIQTCKRINLTAGRGINKSNTGCVEISASLNMD